MWEATETPMIPLKELQAIIQHSASQWDGVFIMMCSVWCPPNKAKELSFGLIRSNKFLPGDFRVSHRPSDEL